MTSLKKLKQVQVKKKKLKVSICVSDTLFLSAEENFFFFFPHLKLINDLSKVFKDISIFVLVKY